MKSLGTLFQLLCFSLAFVGCAFRVAINSDPIPQITEKIDIGVGLYIDEMQMKQTYKKGLYLLETGNALAIAAQSTFRRVFTNVEILKSPSDFAAKPLAFLVTPTIVRFKITRAGIMSSSAQLYLHCRLVNQAGQVVYEKTIYSGSGGQGAAGVLLGVAGAHMDLSAASAEAFNNAFTMLVDDMIKTVDFSAYLRK